MIRSKNISEVFDMEVFTDGGEYFGRVDETVLALNKVMGWRIKATKNSFLNKVLGGAKGVVVPHSMVKSISDVMIISKAAIPTVEEEKPKEATAEKLEEY